MECVISDWCVRNERQMPFGSQTIRALVLVLVLVPVVGVGRHRHRPPPWFLFCGATAAFVGEDNPLVIASSTSERSESVLLPLLRSASPNQ